MPIGGLVQHDDVQKHGCPAGLVPIGTAEGSEAINIKALTGAQSFDGIVEGRRVVSKYYLILAFELTGSRN